MSEIKIESLVSTMNSNSEELYKKMNINSDAIIINQQKDHYIKVYDINNHTVKDYGFNEKGVGLSRNSALLRSSADICLMADDDMIYRDDYISKVKKAYAKKPDADMIIFNVVIHDNSGDYEKVSKEGQLNYFNSLKYGTVTFSFKKRKVEKNNIWFSLLFGGGAKYSNGEDSLFLWDCLKSGMKIYTSKEIIADVYNYESSWFEGYNKKFFRDRGALFEALSPRLSLFLILQYAIRKNKLFKDHMPFNQAVKLMYQGRNEFKNM